MDLNQENNWSFGGENIYNQMGTQFVVNSNKLWSYSLGYTYDSTPDKWHIGDMGEVCRFGTRGRNRIREAVAARAGAVSELGIREMRTWARW